MPDLDLRQRDGSNLDRSGTAARRASDLPRRVCPVHGRRGRRRPLRGDGGGGVLRARVRLARRDAVAVLNAVRLAVRRRSYGQPAMRWAKRIRLRWVVAAYFTAGQVYVWQ